MCVRAHVDNGEGFVQFGVGCSFSDSEAERDAWVIAIEAAKLQLRSMAVTAGTTGRLVLLWAFHSGHLFHIHLAQSCVDIQSAKTILSSLSGDECAWNGSTAGVVTNAFQTAATADRVCA